MTPQVDIRCSAQGCRRLLLSVTTWPEPDSPLWQGSRGVWTEACDRHREIRRREVIADADERRRSRGLPPVDRRALMIHVSWSALRPAFLDSQHRGHAVDVLRP